MNEITKRPWKAVVLLLAVFLAGALVGGVVCRLRPPMGGGRDPNGMIGHLTEELKLTQAQQDSIKAVLERWRPQMDSTWAEVRPRIETVRDSIRSDIAKQLTPEQRAAYEAMLARHHEQGRSGPSRRP
ncbi:MAG TPA: periplasmic heavy metal sensor [Gemmatimonadales bacterium]|nr:periplasmic heavy metal sensor [Gemmatimonadales bacterium]